MTQTKTTDIETAPFEGGEEIIKTEIIGNFVVCERDNTYWAAIGNFRVTNYSTSKSHIIEMIENYGQMMLNISAVMIELNNQLNKK